MTPAVRRHAHQLAAKLELPFAYDGELVRAVNDAQPRLQRAIDRLWSRLHSDAISAVHDHHPAPVETTLANSCSQTLDAPELPQEAQRAQRAVHSAFVGYQTNAERRRQLAAKIGELADDAFALLVAAGWSDRGCTRGGPLRDLATVSEREPCAETAS